MNQGIETDYDFSTDDMAIMATDPEQPQPSKNSAKRRHDADVRRSIDDYLERQRLRRLLSDDLDDDASLDL